MWVQKHINYEEIGDPNVTSILNLEDLNDYLKF